MASAEKQEIVIVRRSDDGEDVVKGGAWKIAHADFMTAMMAFFLVMWLISLTDEETRSGVANYFNPVQLAESTPNKKGLDDPQNVPPDNETDNTKDGKEKGSGEGTGGKSHQLRKPRFKEGALFQDPYAVLARIADEVEANPHDTLGADVTPGESDMPGLKAGEAFRDPFDPLYWQVAPIDELKTETPAKPGTAAPAPSKAVMDAVAALKAPTGKQDAKAPPMLLRGRASCRMTHDGCRLSVCCIGCERVNGCRPEGRRAEERDPQGRPDIEGYLAAASCRGAAHGSRNAHQSHGRLRFHHVRRRFGRASCEGRARDGGNRQDPSVPPGQDRDPGAYGCAALQVGELRQLALVSCKGSDGLVHARAGRIEREPDRARRRACRQGAEDPERSESGSESSG